MERRIPLQAPIGGVDTDRQPVGTAHRCFDLMPWRNGLRKRGRISQLAVGGGMGDSLDPREAYGGAPGWLEGKGWVAVESNAVDIEAVTATHISEDLGTATTGLSDFGLGEWAAGAGGNFMGVDVRLSQPVERWVRAADDLIGIAQNTSLNEVCLVRWGGATLAGDAAITGTVSSTAGARRVTGSGTLFESELEVGAFVCFDPATKPAFGRKWHKVAAISSDTVMYLETAAEISWSGVDLAVTSIVPLNVNPPTAVTQPLFQVVWPTATTTYGTGKYANTPLCRAAAFHQGRLFTGGLTEAQHLDAAQADLLIKDKPYRLRWSALPNEFHPDTDIVNDQRIWRGIEYFESNALLDLGGEGGAITGLVSWNDALVVLRESAVQIVTGAFATDGTDLGAAVQTVARNLGAWSTGAWDVGEEGVYFCDAAGAYLWDGRQVRSLTDGRISQLWEVYYQASTGSAPKQVSCVRNRVLFSGGADNPDVWLSYWPSYNGWFQLNVDNDNEQTNRVVRNYLDDELMVDEAGWFQFRTMLDWDSTSADHLGADENGAADGSYPDPDVTLNPVPVVDGIASGRMLEIQVNHSGKQATYANGSEGAVELAMLDAPAYEQNVIGASIGSSYLKFPDPNDSSTIEVSRTASQNPSSTRPQTHAMLRISPTAGSPASAVDKSFSYTFWGAALTVDVDDKYAD